MNPTQRRFENKVAIITGSASGIGLATAMRIASEGGSVVIADRNVEKAQEAAKKVQAAGAAATWASGCDVTQAKDVEATVEGTIKKFGKVDCIVNNAGLMIFKSIQEHTVKDWTDVLSVDLIGAFLFIQQAFKHMKNGGSIVNISSIHAVETTPLVASYAAAKAALLSLTRSAAIEGKALGIRVNAILPGAVDTPMLWENPNLKSGLEVIKTADVGKPEDLAAAISYLVSDDSKFVQGSSLRVDGGRLAQL